MKSLIFLHPRRAIRPGAALIWLTTAVALAHAAGLPRLPEVDRVLGTLQPQSEVSLSAAFSRPPAVPRVALQADGTLRHLGAPAGCHFRPAAATAGEAEADARRFLNAHAAAFGLAPGSGSNLVAAKLRANGGRRYVKFNQTLAGLPVFGGQAIVQLNNRGGVEYVANCTARAAGWPEMRTAAPLPGLSAEDAAARAREIAAPESRGLPLLASAPRLTWFAPELVGMAGPLRLAWEVSVFTKDRIILHCRMFLDATTGTRLFQYSRSCSILHRTIFDANNNVAWPPQPPLPPPIPRRIEGGPSSSLADVNAAFDGIGDAYNFYLNQHGRRGLNGSDLPIFAAVRVCVSGQGCPWPNAVWSGLPDPPFDSIPGFSIDEGILCFGQGYTVDDIVAHEYTHGVTDFESDLIYANASGAINEAFSDIWGEFADQGNGRGNDQPGVKWDIGEDLSGGRIRSMKFPTALGQPDRLEDGNYVFPLSEPELWNDYGGVHRNSGVINKLCYLLTDGDSFQGYTISGMGMARVAALFYEVNANLLTQAADYTDLTAALHEAASNLGWNADGIANLHLACMAVNTLPNFVGVNTGPSPNGCLRPSISAGGAVADAGWRRGGSTGRRSGICSAGLVRRTPHHQQTGPTQGPQRPLHHRPLKLQPAGTSMRLLQNFRFAPLS